MEITYFPSDLEVQETILEYLAKSNLDLISKKDVRKYLENHFICNFDDKKSLISEVLESFASNTANDQVKSSDADADADELFGIESDGDDELEEAKPVSKLKKVLNSFTKPLQLSTELSEFIGASTCSRTGVVKRLWDYIKSNSLQNPNDRREILCDSALHKVFKRNKMTMFSMNKYLAPLMKKIEDLQEFENEESLTSSSTTKRRKDKKQVEKKEQKPKKKESSSKSPKKSDAKLSTPSKKSKKSEGAKIKPETSSATSSSSSKSATKRKREETSEDAVEPSEKKRSNNAFHKVMQLSRELSALLSVDQETRPQVVSKMWSYVREHNLQNPKDKREFILDEPLKKIFKTDRVTMFTMNKHLSAHLSNI